MSFKVLVHRGRGLSRYRIRPGGNACYVEAHRTLQKISASLSSLVHGVYFVSAIILGTYHLKPFLLMVSVLAFLPVYSGTSHTGNKANRTLPPAQRDVVRDWLLQ